MDLGFFASAQALCTRYSEPRSDQHYNINISGFPTSLIIGSGHQTGPVRERLVVCSAHGVLVAS